MEWKGGIIKPIYKKGCREDEGNYRGITLIDSGYKIYAERLRKRLSKEFEEKEVLDKTQFGFRKGKGTTEAIHVLTEIIENQIKREKGKLFVWFADLKAAFHKVKREEIWKILRKKEIEEKLVRRLEEVYKETWVKIMIEGEIVDEFETEEGVRQGCPLSADLFIAFASGG